MLHGLEPGDSVAFPAGTGVCHTFLNNTDHEVRLMVVGEKRKAENRARYPLNPDFERSTEFGWTDAHPPARPARRQAAGLIELAVLCGLAFERFLDQGQGRLRGGGLSRDHDFDGLGPLDSPACQPPI